MHPLHRLLSGLPVTAPYMRWLSHIKNDVLRPSVEDIIISFMVPGWRNLKILEAGSGPGYKVRDKRFQGVDVTCVDIYKPYLKICRSYGFKTVHADLKNIDKVFKKQSFDIVWFIDVIEHFPKRQGISVLKKLEKIARSQIIISTPLGFYPQDVECVPDKNPYQQHRSAWYPEDFIANGYKCKIYSNYHHDIRMGSKNLINCKEPVSASQIWATKRLE